MNEDTTTRIMSDSDRAYTDALASVTSGEDREGARVHLLEAYPALESSEISDILAEAHTDAERAGVDREDIHETWFA